MATAACLAGSVRLLDQPIKPARNLHEGEVLVIRQGLVTRTLLVKGHPRARVGAALVAQYCEDRTSPEEWEKARANRLEHFLAREKGSGRPTKRERRQLDQFLFSSE